MEVNNFELFPVQRGTDLELTYLTHSLIHSLTAWCRIFFEKLIVNQLVKQQPAFFREPQGSLPCSQTPPLSQLNPVRRIDPKLPEAHF
jgi:hypothetical protein